MRDCVLRGERLGNGTRGTGYAMDRIGGLEGCVLRVGRVDAADSRSDIQILDDYLLHSTYLNPANPLLMHHNLGQYLMTGYDKKYNSRGKPAISIGLKQPGLSIDATLDAYIKDLKGGGHDFLGVRAHNKLWGEILQHAEQTGINPFLKLVTLEHAVKNAHWVPQLNPSNIIYDKKTGQLNLVDQMNEKGTVDCPATLKFTFCRTKKAIGGEGGEYGELIGQYNELAHKMENLIRQAKRTDAKQASDYKATIDLWRQQPRADTLPTNPSICFDTTVPYNISAVKLSSPPRVLVERINKIIRQMELPVPART